MLLTDAEQLAQQQMQAQDTVITEDITSYNTFENANREKITHYNQLLKEKVCNYKVLEFLQGSSVRFQYDDMPSIKVRKLLRKYLPRKHLITKMFPIN